MAKKQQSKKILVVTTSAGEYATKGYRTGLWLGELTHFYDVVVEAGHEVTIVSIAGGQVPLDPESLGKVVIKSGDTDKRYEDRAFMDLLEDTVAITDVDAAEYDALYLPGGHGTMFDLPDNPDLARVVGEMYDAGKYVTAVCHGPAGLLSAARADGRPVVEGKKVTGFAPAEEKLANRADAIPFRLDEALKEQGARYTKALRPFAEKVVRDGTLITGQNPQSAKAVAEELVKRLKKS